MQHSGTPSVVFSCAIRPMTFVNLSHVRVRSLVSSPCCHRTSSCLSLLIREWPAAGNELASDGKVESVLNYCRLSVGARLCVSSDERGEKNCFFFSRTVLAAACRARGNVHFVRFLSSAVQNCAFLPQKENSCLIPFYGVDVCVRPSVRPSGWLASVRPFARSFHSPSVRVRSVRSSHDRPNV